LRHVGGEASGANAVADGNVAGSRLFGVLWPLDVWRSTSWHLSPPFRARKKIAALGMSFLCYASVNCTATQKTFDASQFFFISSLVGRKKQPVWQPPNKRMQLGYVQTEPPQLLRLSRSLSIAVGLLQPPMMLFAIFVDVALAKAMLSHMLPKDCRSNEIGTVEAEQLVEHVVF
jgi:hypothetical protein